MKFKVYGTITTLHEVVVSAKTKSEAEELAIDLFNDSNCYATDNVEVSGISKVGK